MRKLHRHRGADPEDERLFGAGRLAALRQATRDLCRLLDHGYLRTAQGGTARTDGATGRAIGVNGMVNGATGQNMTHVILTPFRESVNHVLLNPVVSVVPVVPVVPV